MDSLQLLRALAALSVVLFHTDWTGIASFGVELFFVLSGFIICYAAAREPERFFAKRLIRVLPLYWSATLGIAVAASVAPHLFPSTEVTLANLIRSLVFIPYLRADGEANPLLFLGWTLNYEMAFYTVFALCLAVSRRWAPLIAAVALTGLTLINPVAKPWGVPADFWTRPILLNFVAGIAAYGLWLWRDRWLVRMPAKLAGAIAAGALLLFIIGAPGWIKTALPMRGILGAVLLLALVRLDGTIRWPAWLLLVGDASYSLYLLHPYVVEAIDRLIHPLSASPLGVALTLVAVALSVGVAIVSYRLIEHPANRALRRRLT